MGCITSKKSRKSQQMNNSMIASNVDGNGDVSGKLYSWSNRDKRDLSRFMIENVTHRTETRFSGEIDGEQFIIQNCSHALICLYDYSNTVMIDDCVDCTIFVGPVVGSIAIRNCEDCRVMSASQQFRTRDCKRLDLFLFCGSQPAIESCSQLRFGCFAANYTGLREQFRKAGLNVFDNKWSHVYDFSLDDHERHWNIFPPNTKASDYFRSVASSGLAINLEFDTKNSLVPQTLGISSLEMLSNTQAISANAYQTNNKFANVDNVPATPTISSKCDRFFLLFVYAADQDGSIDLELEQFVYDVYNKHNKITLLMTKNFPSEQIELKLGQILEDDRQPGGKGISTKSDSQTAVATPGSKPNNRLLVLFYQGDDNGRTILTNLCVSKFGKAPSSSKYKIVDDKHDEEHFARYLSIAFENVIGY